MRQFWEKLPQQIRGWEQCFLNIEEGGRRVGAVCGHGLLILSNLFGAQSWCSIRQVHGGPQELAPSVLGNVIGGRGGFWLGAGVLGDRLSRGFAAGSHRVWAFELSLWWMWLTPDHLPVVICPQRADRAPSPSVGSGSGCLILGILQERCGARVGKGQMLIRPSQYKPKTETQTRERKMPSAVPLELDYLGSNPGSATCCSLIFFCASAYSSIRWGCIWSLSLRVVVRIKHLGKCCARCQHFRVVAGLWVSVSPHTRLIPFLLFSFQLPVSCHILILLPTVLPFSLFLRNLAPQLMKGHGRLVL